MLAQTENPLSEAALVAAVEELRQEATKRLDADDRADFGQFLTPPRVAEITAELFSPVVGSVRLLEPGAGVGSLIATCVMRMASQKPNSIHVTAFEIDAHLRAYLERALSMCGRFCDARSIPFSSEIRGGDFIAASMEMLEPSLFATRRLRFTHVVLNPPYRKISLGSDWHQKLQKLGVGSVNLYTAFLDLSVQLLDDGGELSAIIPRSFCNGTYFKPFRERFLGQMALRHVHSFASRSKAFKGDAVLQENVILHAQKTVRKPETVKIIMADGPDDEAPVTRSVPHGEVVLENDRDQFIHLVPDELSQAIASRLRALPETLSSLGLAVSTGPVVDFRSTPHLRQNPERGAVPLLYPVHMNAGRTVWPRSGKKPNAIAVTDESKPWLVPNEIYVLVKRFSAKEERRRVVAAVHQPTEPFPHLGIENHLNFIHRGMRGLEMPLSCGLSAFLNSTQVDSFFRQFSGHTQVNASDLRKLPFPSLTALQELGKRIGIELPPQEQIDKITQDVVFGGMASDDPLDAVRKIGQAQEVLKALGLPKAQQNERSALSLLALLNLLPQSEWKTAEAPLCGIHPMMDFFRKNYGKDYAENSRETIRRQTLHQFRDAGMLLVNPDEPDRPINSGKTVYQINPELLELLREFGSPKWKEALSAYLKRAPTLATKYAQEREEKRVPIELPDGQKFTLSPGGQNPLVAGILEKFIPQFVKKPKVLYVGDTDTKWAMVDQESLEALGISFDLHGKFPDVIVLDQERNWLLLFEAVTSHGPINPKRHGELKALFERSSAPLVFVTTFLDRKTLVKYLPEIAWETEVWVMSSPTHLIHFNGERFLGPYPNSS